MSIVFIFLFSFNLISDAFGSFVEPFWNSKDYDNSRYGAYPFQEYGSFPLTSPFLNILKWDPQCEYGYTLLTMRGQDVPGSGPMILDARGNLIWTENEWGESANLRIQKYQGEEYLTFWAGTVYGTYGVGKYYMLDSSYQTKHIIEPVGDLHGDMHEFVITPEGTALITIYHNITASFENVPDTDFEEGFITDSVFQEVDIATGKLLFQWHASDFFAVSDSLIPVHGTGETSDKPFDFFHINSITKDSLGNYWISSRYLWALYCISSTNGSILHTLGGRKNDFLDLSGRAATFFLGQHHMTMHPGSRHSMFTPEKDVEYATIFDNGMYDIEGPQFEKQSRAIAVQLNMSDPSKPTVKLVRSYVNPLPIHSISQGSVQLLRPISAFEKLSSATNSSGKDISPGSLLTAALDSIIVESANETIFVGWGQAAGYSAFDAPTGRVLCDVHYASYKSFGSGAAKSYRVFKHMSPWIGKPITRPAIGMSNPEEKRGGAENFKIYASWNGATEVRSWLLQASRAFQGAANDADESGWTNVAMLPKEGFEVTFDLNNLALNKDSFTYYRVLAVPDPPSESSKKKPRAIGISPTLCLTNATIVTPVSDSTNASVVQTLNDNMNTPQEYAISPAVQQPHKRKSKLQAALDRRVHDNGGPFIVMAVLATALVIGIISGWSGWIRHKVKRLRGRASSLPSREEEEDEANAVPLLTMDRKSQDESDDDTRNRGSNGFKDDPRSRIKND